MDVAIVQPVTATISSLRCLILVDTNITEAAMLHLLSTTPQVFYTLQHIIHPFFHTLAKTSASCSMGSFALMTSWTFSALAFTAASVPHFHVDHVLSTFFILLSSLAVRGFQNLEEWPREDGLVGMMFLLTNKTLNGVLLSASDPPSHCPHPSPSPSTRQSSRGQTPTITASATAKQPIEAHPPSTVTTRPTLTDSSAEERAFWNSRTVTTVPTPGTRGFWSGHGWGLVFDLANAENPYQPSRWAFVQVDRGSYEEWAEKCRKLKDSAGTKKEGSARDTNLERGSWEKVSKTRTVGFLRSQQIC